MSEPIVFVSHFIVREGRVEELKLFIDKGAPMLEADKPGTVAFLPYVDQEGSRASIVHVFPDVEAMDRHFEGSDERSAAAYELVQPTGFEIYGRPSTAALSAIRSESEATGVPLEVWPEGMRGFLRLAPGGNDRP